MSGHDEELERLREGVNCAALLERMPPPWKLDRAESTRDCLKYRRGQGEIIIVNHAGRGWWICQRSRQSCRHSSAAAVIHPAWRMASTVVTRRR